VNGVTDGEERVSTSVWTDVAFTPVTDADAHPYRSALGCSTAQLYLGASQEGRMVPSACPTMTPPALGSR